MWRKKPLRVQFVSNFKPLFAAGIIYTIVGILVFNAFVTGPVALISAVKKLDILFALLLTPLFIAEKPTKRSWHAAIMMLIGVILIKI